ncbi:hypothetical protein QR680_012961 [Steinernema hermaphroditum]|uniref:Sjoegren syndrome/scleroderma autoantigen 1 n=1 Tax=Steinernema hermaphroditum TaxID=289476 RepID=A0AA39I5I8_9BILA|nr:hypothetical protein QR680_012961 [Steinernema hermaphroditum]
MVHRRFAAPAESEAPKVTEHIVATSAEDWGSKEVVEVWKPVAIETRSHTKTMNGAKLVDQSEVREFQNRVSEEVSKRMGELLLKGYTMLDQYCDRCRGILMESRSNELICLQCTVVQEMCPPKPEPLTDMDNISDHEPSPKRSAVRNTLPDHSSIIVKEEPLSNMEITDDVHLRLDEYAVQVVARKLKWACEILDASKDPAEVAALIAVVSSATKFLKENKQYISP